MWLVSIYREREIMSRSYRIIHERGFQAGLKEREGSPLVPCPYRQWPLSALRKFKVWIQGWHKGRYA